MFDKLMFWKREPEHSFEHADLGMHESPANDFSSKRLLDDESYDFNNSSPGMLPKTTFQPSNYEQPMQNVSENNFQAQNFPQSFEQKNFQIMPNQQHPTPNTPIPNTPIPNIQRDVELILSKLDTIKAMLDNLTHRVDKVENKDKYW